MSADIEYFSFSQKNADEGWKHFLDDFTKPISAPKLGDPEDSCRARIDNIKTWRKKSGEDRLIFDLKRLDLYYGSVVCRPSYVGRAMYGVVESLAEAGEVSFVDGSIAKEDWIKLYTMMDRTFFVKVVKVLTRNMKWTDKESSEVLLDLLGIVRPMVKDLKENFDNLFVSLLDGNIEVDQSDAEKLLAARAKQHFLDFREIILGVAAD